MRVLVTGGAGYIGSHTVRRLLDAGHEVVVYDNLSRGHREAVAGVPLVEGDIRDGELLRSTLARYGCRSILHFAALSLVGESARDPQAYYLNNVGGGLTLLQAALHCGVPYFVFSSSAAVYGEPYEMPIREDFPLEPVNPYGETKMVLEKALASYSRAYNFRAISLRYFNAAGASSAGDIGEDHDPETHLIPLVLRAIMTGEELTVFSDDYPTPDGTAVRDYIHVDDLAAAHVLALEALEQGSPTAAYNLGSGRGYSVLEVIKAAEKVTGQKVPYRVGPRRPGDPAVLVASAEKAMVELGWRPRYTELEDIIATAWQWHRRRPRGYSQGYSPAAR